ncbi:hypothetical protein [uncultured Tenacibaculum sp.]|uniref:hypothetical protein n=1 Tax=uncultured Tenacibaculum sp. TaxID=174713 RepID=UPI002612E4C1|nr:hypothetical protein [uncultured Tenacibaculum sp.]
MKSIDVILIVEIMNYKAPKLFKPTPEEFKNAAKRLTKHITIDYCIVSPDGEKIRGNKEI